MRNNQLITALGMQALLCNENYLTGDFHQALLDIAYGDWQRHDDALVYQTFVRGERGAERQVVREGTRAEIDEWWRGQIEEGRAEEMGEWSTALAEGQSGWGYADMLHNARHKYGELFFVMTLAGKYNQQVCNGGHLQYFHNGYGSGDSGGFGFGHDPGVPLHREMVRELERSVLPLAETDTEKSVLGRAIGVMRDLRVRIDNSDTVDETCETCQGGGTVDCDSCDGSGYVDGDGDGEDQDECRECGGTGQVDCDSCDGKGHYETENSEKGEVVNGEALDALDTRWYEVEGHAMRVLNAIAARVIGGDAPGILAASYIARGYVETAQSNRMFVIPALASGLTPRGEECYVMIMRERVRYEYLEAIDGGVGGYRKNRVTEARRDLWDRVREMKPGDEIIYWEEIADRYDEDGADGCARQDIREAYDDVLDRYVGDGTLEPMTKDDNGNEITYGYRKAAKK
jgi:hypothetical protein